MCKNIKYICINEILVGFSGLSYLSKNDFAKFGKDVTILFPNINISKDKRIDTLIPDNSSGDLIPELIGACRQRLHLPNPRF